MEVFYVRLVERAIVTACVPILLYIGYRLFESGATGKMTLTAKAEGRFAKLTNLSPGALCFVLAVTLGATVMFRGISVETPVGRTSGFGGATATGGQLSDVIEEVHADIGFQVQELVLRPNTTIEQVRGVVKSTIDNSHLRRSTTRSSLKEIESLESGEIDDEQALSQWHRDLIGGR